MEFPITKERLQNYISSGEAYRVERQKKIDEHIKRICFEIERHFIEKLNQSANPKAWGVPKTTFVINQLERNNAEIFIRTHFHEPILEDVVKRLKQLFIDCRVEIDPLKTYILIDWS